MTYPTPQSWKKIEKILDKHYLEGIHSLKNHGVAKEISDWMELELAQEVREERKRRYCLACGEIYTCSCHNPNSPRYL